MIENEDEFEGLVLYTDGSCRPNPGKSGYGLHGYLYTTEKEKQHYTYPNHHITTEHGYIIKKEYKEEECGKIVFPRYYIDIVGYEHLSNTNNQAEMDAIINGLAFVIDRKLNIKQLTFYSDCEYLIGGFKNKNKLNNPDTPNFDKWSKLFDLMGQMETLGISVKLEWIKAHSGLLGNELADMLANIGVNKRSEMDSGSDINIVPSSDYWKHQFERHPMICHKMLYYNVTQKNKNRLYLIDPGGASNLVGRTLVKSSYGILDVSEDLCIDIIDVLTNVIELRNNKISSVVIIDLNVLYHPYISNYLSTYKSNSLKITNKSKLTINFINPDIVDGLNGQWLANELVPARHAIRAENDYSFLSDVFGEYKNPGSNPDMKKYKIESTNITDTFYEVVENKNGSKHQLRKGFKVGFKELKISKEISGLGKEIDFQLLLGHDLPNRNALKKLEKTISDISLITWYKDKNAIFYAIGVKTKDGVRGIFSNLFTNIVYI